MDRKTAETLLNTHPCFCEGAHTKFARMHIPVAPRCNIQCNYCNRKYDCCNESRPGVTSEVLTALEASDKVGYVKEKIPQLSVIGIAGPGDPLANEATFESLKYIGDRYPDLTLCVSTNGLALPATAERLHDLNVGFITVTINACDPEISKDIYDSVIWEGKRLEGVEGAARLLENQLEGIRKCNELGVLVKANIVLIPGINDKHIPDLVKKLKSLDVYIINILPLIPVEGTKFSNRKAPTSTERRELMDLCSLDARMMRHCKQCRADAIGLLGNDRSAEFAGKGCNSSCESIDLITDIAKEEVRIAVATSDGKNVNCGFGNAPEFHIYASDGKTTRYLRTEKIDTDVEVSGKSHANHLSSIYSSIKDCKIVVVCEIGEHPAKDLETRNIRVIVTKGDINSAVRNAANSKL